MHNADHMEARVWEPKIEPLSKTIVAFLQTLDDNIKTMETSLATSTPSIKAAKLVANARKRRNAEVPINQLPIEVTAEIFKFAVLPSRSVPSSDESHLQKLGMIANVCARWYNIVKSTAALWAVVETTVSDEMLELLLERSKNSPLFVTCGSGYHQNDSAMFKELWTPSSSIMKVVSEIIRWRSVDIGLTSAGSNILRALETPAPILEEFNFYLETPRAHKITNLFKGKAPKLKQLRVSGLSFVWSKGLFHNLTHLQIANIRHNGPTLTEVITAIHSSPKLEIILLHDLAFSSDSAIPSTQPVVLKDLEFISITSLPSFETQTILSSIDAPELRNLIALPRIRGAERITSSFVDASFYHFQETVQTALSHSRHMEITFIHHAIEIRTSARHPASDNWFCLRIPHQSDAESFEACLPNFIFDPPRDIPIRLRVQAIPRFSKIELKRIFERFRWVTSIDMNSRMMVPGLDDFLEFMISGWVEKDLKRWPFPRLVAFQPQRWIAPNQLVRMIKEREGVDGLGDVEPESYQSVFKVLPARIARLEVRSLYYPLDRSQYEEIANIVGHNAIN